ncbi:MAG: hypothetical protein ACJ74E_07145 [Actinomycetes bacterium]
MLRHSRVLVVAGAALLVVALVAALDRDVFGGDPSSDSSDGQTDPCNGDPALCSRPYNEVAFPATHNAMSTADEGDWFRPQQPTDVIGQLDAGVRVFLIDSWYGQTTDQSGVVTNIAASRREALGQARQTFGTAAVERALRASHAGRLDAVGPVEPYLCHNLCELGATLWEPLMEEVAKWMRDHPREVVTFFIQDTVTAEDTATLFSNAGLTPYVYTPTWGQPWPTLGQMIESGKRLVVLMENHDGGPDYPWLLRGFKWVQDTPYDTNRVPEFSCTRLRGKPNSPLFLVNHWLSNPRSRAAVADKANSARVLGEHLRRCESERGMIPNFVAVDFYDHGSLFAQVDRLNGLS